MTSTFAAPVLVSVTVWACELPTVILPKVSLVGFRDNCPTATAVPTPLSATFVTASDALLVTDSVALKAPAVSGVNAIPTVVLCPGSSVTGRVGLVTEKYLVEIDAALTVTALKPEFVAENVRVLVLPAGTLPKSRLEVANDRSVDCVEVGVERPAALIPWQPANQVSAVRISAVAISR